MTISSDSKHLGWGGRALRLGILASSVALASVMLVAAPALAATAPQYIYRLHGHRSGRGLDFHRQREHGGQPAVPGGEAW